MLPSSIIRLSSLLLLAAWGVPGAAPSRPEDELKAAVLLSFLRYAEWPTPLPPNGAIAIGVVGRAAFAATLRQSLEGKPVNDHTIKIVELKTAADAQPCQVVYFAAERPSELTPASLAANAPHALSMGEAKGFLEAGGAVNLMLIDGRMSFEVSLDALDRSGVTISSKLLRFGRIQTRGKRGTSS